MLIDKGKGVGEGWRAGELLRLRLIMGLNFHCKINALQALRSGGIKAGVAEEWYSSYPRNPQGHPRYRGVPAMTAVAKYLAKGKNLLQATRIKRLIQTTTGWQVLTDTHQSFEAKALLITCPVPQTLDLLSVSGIAIAESILQRLSSIEYERCIAVMATLDASSDMAPPGALYLNTGPIAWLSDNEKKGLSSTPAITIHASADFSLSILIMIGSRWAKNLLMQPNPI